MPPMFKITHAYSSGAVLQREKKHCIWGAASKGSEIVLSIGDVKYKGMARDGHWMNKFGPLPTGGPYTIIVKSGTEEIVISDITVGDVWLICGQSNAAILWLIQICHFILDLDQTIFNFTQTICLVIFYEGAKPGTDLAANPSWEVHLGTYSIRISMCQWVLLTVLSRGHLFKTRIQDQPIYQMEKIL